MSLDNVKWRRPVVPGDQLRFELEMVQFRGQVPNAGRRFRGRQRGRRGGNDGLHRGQVTEGVHPSVVIDPGARIAAGVTIGPFAVIGPGVSIGAGCRLGAHVVMERHMRLGARSPSAPARARAAPQDVKYAETRPRWRSATGP